MCFQLYHEKIIPAHIFLANIKKNYYTDVQKTIFSIISLS